MENNKLAGSIAMMLNEFQMRLLLEADKIIDSKIQEQINEFAFIQKQLEDAKKLVKELADKSKELAQAIEPVFEELDTTIMTTEKALVELKRKSHDRLTTSYKDAFALALTKVNAQTRRVLEQALEESKKLSHVSASWKVEVYERNLDEDFVSFIKDVIRKAVSRFKKLFSQAKQASKEAKNLLNIAKSA